MIDGLFSRFSLILEEEKELNKKVVKKKVKCGCVYTGACSAKS